MIGMVASHYFRLFPNPRRGVPGTVVLPQSGYRRARAAIAAWPGYAPTPLVSLPEIAAAANVTAVHYKNEAGRFGQGSFKALGGGYAVFRVLAAELARRGVVRAAAADALERGDHGAATRDIIVCCATDGNHGRAVAWGARRFGCQSVVFVHPGVPAGRRAAIARLGAEVREVPGGYDDAVRAAAGTAVREGWFVVSDTSWPGYTAVPEDVMQGYRVMADEALAAMPAPPTHCFVQGGVGGVAAAVSAQLRAHPGAATRLVVVEPEAAACLLASAEAGERVALPGAPETTMDSLNCGEPSLLAWAELERAAHAFMVVPDAAAVACVALLAGRTPPVAAGPSAVAGLAGLLLAAADPAARSVLALDGDSRILLFGTEGPLPLDV